MTRTTIGIFGYFLLACVLACVATSIWLQLHNQFETDYLIYFDFWRNYAALRFDKIYPFIYHNVHMYMLASMVWYYDVLRAYGDLPLVHAYVDVVTVMASAAIIYTYHAGRWSGVNGAHIGNSNLFGVLAAFTSIAIWLSPSNASMFSYPLVDIVACTVLCLLFLTGILCAGFGRPPGSESSGRMSWRLVAYLVVMVLGFLTLETFILVPVYLALEAALFRRSRDATLHALLIGLLVIPYWLFLRYPVGARTEIFHVVVIAWNFLVLLSSHYEHLLQAFGLAWKAVAPLGVLLSIIQLGAYAALVSALFIKRKEVNGMLRTANMLAAFAVGSLMLATLLRYWGGRLDAPVLRYTLYTTLFSMSLLLLAIEGVRHGGRKIYALSMAVFAMNVSYVLLDQYVIYQGTSNPGFDFALYRLDMAAYALHPDADLPLGPADPDGGKAVRTSALGLLRAHNWSVFSSDGYRALGTTIPASSIRSANRCRHDGELRGWSAPDPYRYEVFRGADAEGTFLIADSKRVVVGFSFAAATSPFSGNVIALVPNVLPAGDTLFLAHYRYHELLDADACQ